MRTNQKAWLASSAAAAILTLTLSAFAEDAKPAPADAQPVTTLNGQPITDQELTAAFQEIGQQLQQRVPPDQILRALTDFVIDVKLASKAAVVAGYDKDPGVAARLSLAHDYALYQEYLGRTVVAQVSEDAIKKRFDEELAKFVPADEPHVFHILVKEEADAQAIIAELDKGADFGQLAKDKSIDTGSAVNGGDVGFTPKGMMVPEFEAAAYALEVGTYTKTPVKSQYGWHVIKVTEKRKEPAPTLDAEHDRIRQELISEVARASRADLRKGAEVVYPKPAAPDAPAPGDANAPAAPSQP